MSYLFDAVDTLPPLEVRFLDIPLASFLKLCGSAPATPIAPIEHSYAQALPNEDR